MSSNNNNLSNIINSQNSLTPVYIEKNESVKKVESEWRDGETVLRDNKVKYQTVGGQLSSRIWIYYLVGEYKNPNTKRYKVRCKFCLQEMEGRKERMMRHSGTCEKIPPEERAKVIDIKVLMMQQKASKPLPASAKKKKRGVIDETTVSNSSSLVKNELNALITRAFVDGEIPLSFIENDYLINFLKKLNPSFQPPLKAQLIQKFIPDEYAIALSDLSKQLIGLEDLSLLIDEWKDHKGNTIYGFLASTSQMELPFFLDIFDTSDKVITVEFLKEKMLEILNQLELKIGQFKAIVTKNSSILNRLKESCVKDFPHLISLPCFSSIMNQIAAIFLNHPLIQDTLRKGCRLLDLLQTTLPVLSKQEFQSKFTSQDGNKNILSCLDEENPYPVLLILKAVEDYKDILDIKQISGFPKLTLLLEELKIDSKYWKTVYFLSSMFRLIVSTISSFENSSTLAENFSTFIQFYKQVLSLEVTSEHSTVVDYLKTLIQKSFENQLDLPIYVISLYLHPRYIELACSKAYSPMDVYSHILNIAALWKFTKREAMELRNALRDFIKHSGCFKGMNYTTKDALYWWKNIQSTDFGVAALKKLALQVHGLVSNVESLTENIKMKSKRNTIISIETLKKMEQLKRNLYEKQNDKEISDTKCLTNKRKRLSLEPMATLNTKFETNDVELTEEIESFFASGTFAPTFAFLNSVELNNKIASNLLSLWLSQQTKQVEEFNMENILYLDKVQASSRMLETIFDLNHPSLSIKDIEDTSPTCVDFKKTNGMDDSDCVDWDPNDLKDSIKDENGKNSFWF